MVIVNQSEELPFISHTWYDDDGDVIDFSTQPHTFEIKVLAPDGSKTTKSTGFTGYPTRPNLRIEWATSGDLVHLPAGEYHSQWTATNSVSGKTYIKTDQFIVRPVV